MTSWLDVVPKDILWFLLKEQHPIYLHSLGENCEQLQKIRNNPQKMSDYWNHWRTTRTPTDPLRDGPTKDQTDEMHSFLCEICQLSTRCVRRRVEDTPRSPLLLISAIDWLCRAQNFNLADWLYIFYEREISRELNLSSSLLPHSSTLRWLQQKGYSASHLARIYPALRDEIIFIFPFADYSDLMCELLEKDLPKFREYKAQRLNYFPGRLIEHCLLNDLIEHLQIVLSLHTFSNSQLWRYAYCTSSPELRQVLVPNQL